MVALVFTASGCGVGLGQQLKLGDQNIGGSGSNGVQVMVVVGLDYKWWRWY